MNTKPYTFETFITTPSNRQARTAAEKVCRFPGGRNHNLLVLCGANGTGKTHLLHAMAASFLENGIPNIYVPAHQIARSVIECIQSGDMWAYEELYCQADVLLIDDIHDLIRKETTQKSVLHLIEKLLDQGKQVVISGNELFENGTLTQPLRECLSRGLRVQLDAPDLESKVAIIEQSLSNHGIHWPRAAYMYIAEKTNGSISQLEGELKIVEFLHFVVAKRKRGNTMLIHIKSPCEELADEWEITPNKQPMTLYELTQLRNATKINDPDRPGLICIGSRPGMGKTAFALDIVLDAAISNQKDILIFSLEMTAKQIAERLLRKLCGVNIREFRNSTRSEDDKAKLSAAIAFLQERNILIDDNFNTSPAYIEKCIQSCENPGVVLIDYLQLLHADEKEDAYQLEICKIIRSLLLQSRKYCVKMVVLTQIGRIFRKDKRPILDDIRSIGCLHQDSDVVLFVYRDEYYENNSANDAAEIIIAKNRYGECCTIHMRFDGLSVSFRENAAIESEIAKAE